MRMRYFPINLDLNERRCLVIGGGTVAERKVANLLSAGARVTVISPLVTEVIAKWSKTHMIDFTARVYREGDLQGYRLVFAATSDPKVNRAIVTEARRCGVWINAADDPQNCDFILPSVLSRGDLTITVSTGGQSPALARTLREELEMQFSAEYEQLAKLATEVRNELRQRNVTLPFEIWRDALCGDVRQLLMRGDNAKAKQILLRDLGVTLS